ARASLASAYRDAKKPKDALSLYERIVADRERLEGPGHPDAILARCDLAVACLSARKFGLSVQQYERALTDSEQALGYHHPVTESVRQDLNAAASIARSTLGIDLRSLRPANRSLLARSGQNSVVVAGRPAWAGAHPTAPPGLDPNVVVSGKQPANRSGGGG